MCRAPSPSWASSPGLGTPVPSCAEANVPLCPAAWAPALSADQELPGRGGGQALPSPLPPSFFISVILKGALVLVYYLWGCQRHLGLGVCVGGLVFPCGETTNNKGEGPPVCLWSVFLSQAAALGPGRVACWACTPSWQPWRPKSCLPGTLPPVRLCLKPKPLLSTIPTPQEASRAQSLLQVLLGPL